MTDNYKSVLEDEYVPQSRPYSQNELREKRDNLYKDLRLSKTYAYHKKCKHFYLVKENGRKEKDILENKTNLNCSVCWKLNRTPEHLKTMAYNLVDEYSKQFSKNPTLLTYDLVDLEILIYKWIYRDRDEEDDYKKIRKNKKRFVKSENTEEDEGVECNEAEIEA
jgi:hypothetical protein